MVLSILCLLFVLLIPVQILAELLGKIESCSGFSLNSFPELKSFLKDGEAESYQNLQVDYIHGRQAILTIVENGIEIEQITLSDYKTKEELHNLFKSKGFELKTDEDIKEMKETNAIKSKKEEEENIRSGDEMRLKRMTAAAERRAIEAQKKALEEEQKKTKEVEGHVDSANDEQEL